MISNEKSEVDRVLTAIAATSTAADIQYVTDFCAKMFVAVASERSEEGKLRLYNILQDAVGSVALFADDFSPADLLEKLIARADFEDDVVDGPLFRDRIIFAFRRSEFSQFGALRMALERAQKEAEIRCIARLFKMSIPSVDDEMRRFFNSRCPTRRKRR